MKRNQVSKYVLKRSARILCFYVGIPRFWVLFFYFLLPEMKYLVYLEFAYCHMGSILNSNRCLPPPPPQPIDFKSVHTDGKRMHKLARVHIFLQSARHFIVIPHRLCIYNIIGTRVYNKYKQMCVRVYVYVCL